MPRHFAAETHLGTFFHIRVLRVAKFPAVCAAHSCLLSQLFDDTFWGSSRAKFSIAILVYRALEHRDLIGTIFWVHFRRDEVE